MASSGNGKVSAADLVYNIWASREQLLRAFMDPVRDIDKACSYPDAVAAQFYRDLFDRHAIANRIVRLMPAECWQVIPRVFEDASAKNRTAFEESWEKLGQSLMGSESYNRGLAGSRVWEYLHRVDTLSGIGVYGLLLLGIDDGKLLEQPLDGVQADGAPKDMAGDIQTKDIYGGMRPVQQLSAVSGTDAQYFQTQFSVAQPPGAKKGERRLLFLRCFDESLVQVVQYEASMYSPRFGMPVMYLVTLNDPRQPHTGIGLPLATVRVHWSRVVHVADNLTSSEIFGVPRLRPVLNNVLDLRKIYGAGAEGYWKAAFAGLSLETNPQLGGDVLIDVPKLKEMVHDYFEGLERALTLSGMTAKTLAPTVTDPGPHIQNQLEAICIQLGCPVRVFKGSERGELASGQDDAAWNDRLKHRQDIYITPRVVSPFIDRLIQVGVLPKPEGYTVEWPDLESNSETEKKSMAMQETQAIAAYVQGGLQSMVPPIDYLTKVLGWTQDKAASVLTDAASFLEGSLEAPEPVENEGADANAVVGRFTDEERDGIAVWINGGEAVVDVMDWGDEKVGRRMGAALGRLGFRVRYQNEGAHPKGMELVDNAARSAVSIYLAERAELAVALALNAERQRDERGRFASVEGDAGGGVKWKAYRKSFYAPTGKEGPTQFDAAGKKLDGRAGRRPMTQRSALVYEENPLIGSGAHRITERKGEYNIAQLQGGKRPWSEVKDEHEAPSAERERGHKWAPVEKGLSRAGAEAWLFHKMGRGEIRKLLDHIEPPPTKGALEELVKMAHTLPPGEHT